MRKPCSYVLARSDLADQLAIETMPTPVHTLDPSRMRSGPFVARLHELCDMPCRESGLEVPRWAFYDCGIGPGLALGLCWDESAEDEGGHGPRLHPLTAVTALPQVQPGHWLFYDLRGPLVPDDQNEDLREATLRLALAAIRPEGVTGETQWSSDQLDIHCRIATLEIIAAWLPTHDIAASLVFRYTDQPLASGRVAHVDVTDPGALRALQDTIEAGHRVQLRAQEKRSSNIVQLTVEQS